MADNEIFVYHRGNYVHIETPLGIVNIRCGLIDSEGHPVDSIEMLPDTSDGVRLDGMANSRFIAPLSPPDDEGDR